MKVQLVHIAGGVSLRDTDQKDSEKCRVIGKIYLPSDAFGIRDACNAHDELVGALRYVAEMTRHEISAAGSAIYDRATRALAAAGAA
jgi:hypothetical protein